MLNLFHGRIDRAAVRADSTAVDEIIVAVDDAAETPRPLPINVHVLMRNNRAAFDNLEVQLPVVKVIFIKDALRGVGIVQVIDIDHRYSSSFKM